MKLVLVTFLALNSIVAFTQITEEGTTVGSQIFVDSVMSILGSYENPNDKIHQAVNVAIEEQNLGRKISLLQHLKHQNYGASDTSMAKIWYELGLTHLATGQLDSSHYYISELLTVSERSNYMQGQIGETGITLEIVKEAVVLNVDQPNVRFNVYPNPVSDALQISGLEAAQRIQLMNLQGQVIRRLESGQGINEVDISEIPSGTYLLQVSDQSNRIIHNNKIIKR